VNDLRPDTADFDDASTNISAPVEVTVPRSGTGPTGIFAGSRQWLSGGLEDGIASRLWVMAESLGLDLRSVSGDVRSLPYGVVATGGV
jgi:hypothetical protein